MSNKNINIEVIDSILSSDSVWLEDFTFLREDYRLLANKIETYYNNKKQMPSCSFLKKSVHKFSQDKSVVKKLESIMEVVTGKESEFSKSELRELLAEDYKKRELSKRLIKAGELVNSGDFESLGHILEQSQELSKVGGEVKNWLKTDSRNSLAKIKTSNNMVSSGLNFGLNSGAEFVPKGSMINLIGASGTGKSILALQAMVNNFLDGRNQLMFNYELGLEEIALRIKSYISKVPAEEIIKESYSSSDSAIRVKAVEYVLKYEITLNEAVSIINNKKENTLKDKPLRMNSLKIISAKGDYTYTDDYSEADLEDDDLPTDLQVIDYLRDYGKDVDDVYIDLMTELEFANPSSSEANDYKVFARKAKALAKKHSFRIWLLNQVHDENSANGLVTNKYSRSLLQTSDLCLVVLATLEMVEEEQVCIAIKKCRHGIPNIVIPCQRNFSIFEFKFYEGTETIWLSQVMKEFDKQFKSKNK